MLYYLELPPIVNRYNVDWNKWFPEIFSEKGIDFEIIRGGDGEFKCKGKMFFEYKDIMSWKFMQLNRLMKKIHSSININIETDIIFIPDIYYPGIETLYFYKKLYNRNIKLVSVIHAGSYIPYDYTYIRGMERVCKELEEVWLNMCDLVFVATNYHKEKILECRNIDENKIKVIGLPSDINGLYNNYRIDFNKRSRDFIFAGRLGIDKGYDIINFVEKYCNINIYKSYKYKLNKSEFYNEIANSKSIISPSRLETFGYAVVEAMSMDVIPIVPSGIAFDDYVPKKYRYDPYDLNEFIEKIQKVKDYNGEVKMKKYVEKYQYQDVINNMIKEINKL